MSLAKPGLLRASLRQRFRWNFSPAGFAAKVSTFANAERRLSGWDYYHAIQNKENIIMLAKTISSTM